MEHNADNIVQNVGAIAETVSIFYNSIARQVPKDVALVLTRHFMDLTINRRPVNAAVINGNVAAAVAVVQAQEAKRRAMEQKKQLEKNREKAAGQTAQAEESPELPGEAQT